MIAGLEGAVRRHFLRDETIRGYCAGERVWPTKLKQHPSDNGGRAIRLRLGEPWRTRGEINSNLPVTLIVECWAAPSRNSEGETVADDAIPNARALWDAVDRLVHGSRDERWGALASSAGVWVLTASLWRGPVDFYDAAGKGANALPGIDLRDCAVTYAEYALDIA